MEIEKTNPHPILDVLYEAELELLDRVEDKLQRDSWASENFLEYCFDNTLSTLVLPTERAFEHGDFFSIETNFIQREWHQRWRQKFLEKMKIVSLRQFEEEVHEHHFLCLRGTKSEKPQWRICSSANDNSEKVVVLPQTQNGWVYKFCREFHNNLMQTVQSARAFFRDENYVQASVKALFSPIDILLKIQERNSLDCFNLTELLILEDSRLMLKEKPIPGVWSIHDFLRKGIGEEDAALFLTQNDRVLCIYDICAANCGEDHGTIKVIDGPSGIFKSSDMEKEYHWLRYMPRIGVDEEAFTQWESNQIQRDTRKQQIRKAFRRKRNRRVKQYREASSPLHLNCCKTRNS